MPARLFISAGEPSGDQHAARLIRQLKAIRPDCQLRGFGGPAMAAAGVDLDAEITSMAVMGFFEVLPRIKDFWKLAQQARTTFRSGEVDALLLLDYPGFHWHLARHAHDAGVPVLYYLPPQLWAWAPWRLRKIRKYVDQVLTVLPFEHDWYVQRGVAANYVGHPFFDAVAESQLDQAMLDHCADLRRGGKRLVAVLPGSREREVLANGPLLCAAMQRLAIRHPECTFLIGAYREKHAHRMQAWIREANLNARVECFVSRTSEVIQAAECAMMVSGSVSLELLARDTPAAVVYRVGRVTHEIARRLVKLSSFSLPNLLAGRTLFPEFLSVGDPEPAIGGLTETIDAWLSDPDRLNESRQGLAELASQVARPGASAKAAQVVAGHLPESHSDRRAA